MGDVCDLRAANGEDGTHCDSEECSFWRVVAHVGGGSGAGCAIKHYELLGNDEVAAWLLSVKERLDSVEHATCGDETE
jgi:hypothetical protein